MPLDPTALRFPGAERDALRIAEMDRRLRVLEHRLLSGNTGAPSGTDVIVGGDLAGTSANVVVEKSSAVKFEVGGYAVFGGTADHAGTEPIEAQGTTAGISLWDRTTGSTDRWVMYGDAGSLRFWKGSDKATLSAGGDFVSESMRAKHVKIRKNVSAADAPELHFEGLNSSWIVGIDVANNGGSRDFVLAAIKFPNDNVGDIVYLAKNEIGLNEAYPTLGVGVTPPDINYMLQVSPADARPAMGGLRIRVGPSQTGHAMFVQNSAGGHLFALDSAGRMIAGNNTAVTVARDAAGDGDLLTIGNKVDGRYYKWRLAGGGDLYLSYATGGNDAFRVAQSGALTFFQNATFNGTIAGTLAAPARVKSTATSGITSTLKLVDSVTGALASGTGTAIQLVVGGGGFSDDQYFAKIAAVAENSSPSFLNPSLRFYTMANVTAAGNEQERLRISADGKLWMDPSAALDTNLYRDSTNGWLRTDGGMQVGGNAYVMQNVNVWTDSGRLNFGAAQDTNLYRLAADVLRTDDTFTAALAIRAYVNLVHLEDGPLGSGLVAFGSAKDASLWRKAAGVVGVTSYVDAAGGFRVNGVDLAATHLTNGTTGTGNIVLAGGTPAFSGNPTAPTPATADDSTKLATTAWVRAQGYATTAGGAPDASATVKGISKLSVAAAVSTDPIVVGTNDPRVTADQAAGTASIRTIGTGALQAAAGNHTHANMATTDTAQTFTGQKTHTLDLKLDPGSGTAGLGVYLTPRSSGSPLSDAYFRVDSSGNAEANGSSSLLLQTGAVTRATVDSTGINLASGNTYRINGTNIFASPALTGTPTAPTAAASTDTTQVATTAFVKSQTSVYFSTHKNGTNQTGLTGSAQVTFSTEEADTQNAFATNAFTAPRAGRYMLLAHVHFYSTPTAGRYYAEIRKNGSLHKRLFDVDVDTAGDLLGGGHAVIVDSAAGDVWTVWVTGAGTYAVSGHTAETYFQGQSLA